MSKSTVDPLEMCLPAEKLARNWVTSNPDGIPFISIDTELRAYFDWLKRGVEDEDWKADYEKAYQVAFEQRWTMEIVQRLRSRHLTTRGVKSGVAIEVILRAHGWWAK